MSIIFVCKILIVYFLPQILIFFFRCYGHFKYQCLVINIIYLKNVDVYIKPTIIFK